MALRHHQGVKGFKGYITKYHPAYAYDAYEYTCAYAHKPVNRRQILKYTVDPRTERVKFI